MIQHGVGCAAADLFGVANCAQCRAGNCGVVKELDEALDRIKDLEEKNADLQADVKSMEAELNGNE